MSRTRYLLTLCAVGPAILLAGCGSSNSSSSTTPVSGLKKRVLISNREAAAIVLVDAQKDVVNSRTFSVGSPTKMLTASGTTAILDSATNQISFLTNSTETITATSSLQGIPADIALSPDGLTAYAAVRNVGVVEVIRTSDGAIVGTVNVPSASRLVEGPNGHKLLAFADGPTGNHTFFVIDTGTNTLLPPAGITDPSLNQPYTAVFDTTNTNDTAAFVLTCGSECGCDGTSCGTAAGVVRVDFSGTPALTPVTGPANAFTTNPVAGATVGMLNGSKLFIAGTLPTPLAGACPANIPSCGSLQVIDTGSLTVTATVPITNGLHQQMAMTTSNRVYVGASNCAPGPNVSNQVRGCLSIFNTGTSATVFPVESSLRQDFNVTGFQPISNRSVIYVIQGGELDIFDINADAVAGSITPIDLVGNAIDAIQIDP